MVHEYVGKVVEHGNLLLAAVFCNLLSGLNLNNTGGICLNNVHDVMQIVALSISSIVGVLAALDYVHKLQWKRKQNRKRKDGKAEMLTDEEYAMLVGFRKGKR